MNFSKLMETLALKGRNGFTLKGHYGVLVVSPDGHNHSLTHEPTYWVDATHVEAISGEEVHQRQGGFRFSTVGCLCACVCYGENTVDTTVIREVNIVF